MEPSKREVDPRLVRAFRRAVMEKIARDLEREQRLSHNLRTENLPHIKDGIEAARAEGLCERVWLFGSFAWGQPTERSDIDILVKQGRDLTRIACLVGDALQRDVHVVSWDDADETLCRRAREQGIEL